MVTGASATPPVPREPESENSEYILDLVTNRYHPDWQDAWDAGDNRFRLRLGSNNVARWFLEEELKATASLVGDRLRLRFWHARKLRHETEELRGDTFELEARFRGRNYLSLCVTPTAAKADNAVGFILQHRRAVDRYTKFFIELPNVVRNFVEREKDSADSLITVFARRPVRIGLAERGVVAGDVTFWLEAEIVPQFTIEEREQRTDRRTRRENAYARSLLVRVERLWAPHIRRLGVEGGYRLDKRRGHPVATNRPGNSGIAAVAVIEFDDALYGISADDSITGWRNERWWARPYAWVGLSERVSLRGAVHVERREIKYQHRDGATWTVENRYVVPLAGIEYAVDVRGRNVIEFGWASSLRKRERLQQFARESENMQDDRLYLSYEYAVSESSRLRDIESFELDGPDRGDYGIHDHGFVQLIVGF